MIIIVINISLILLIFLGIDHFIPLENVRRTTKSTWKKKTIEDFINNTQDPVLMIAVNSNINRLIKSSRTPYSFLPNNKQFTPYYILMWLMTKPTYNLQIHSKVLDLINRSDVQKILKNPNSSNIIKLLKP